MEVSFLGLVSPSGVLPHHYTRLLRLRLKENDSAMRDFLELFQHRLISHFFRASTKYHLPIQYEFFSFPSNSPQDLISRSLLSCVGFGHDELLGRMGIEDRLFLFYAGHFAHQRPTKTGLIRMLRDWTGLGIEVREFQLEWLQLEPPDQTRLSAPHARLGVNTIAGNRVPSIQNRFRIRLGGLKWSEFLSLLPNRERLRKMADFTRAYVGLSLDFDFQLVLYGHEMKCARLGSQETGLLGWNTWCFSELPQHDVDDAVFEVDTTSGTTSHLGG
jgi:type VI secretion system protein ImpH